MIRRGFWRENAGQPSLPAELIKRQGEVRRELDSLAKDAAAYEDPDRALKRIQIERMKAARERRVETKKKLAKARYDRAIAWHQRQGKAITHLGDDVSSALHGAEGKAERLAQLKLPAIADPAGLAAAMGIKLGELRFLAYDRKVAKVDHYSRFTIPKKTGGVREISAPMPRLKRAQYWIMKNILEPLPGHAASHGFRTQRSILTQCPSACGPARGHQHRPQGLLPDHHLCPRERLLRQPGLPREGRRPLGADLHGCRARQAADRWPDLEHRARRAALAARRADQPGDRQPDRQSPRQAHGRRRQGRWFHLHALCRRHDLLGQRGARLAFRSTGCCGSCGRSPKPKALPSTTRRRA